MIRVANILTNNRQMKALTGLTKGEFDILLINFTTILYEHFAKRDRKRGVGGGRKGSLIDTRNKLFYILFYLKIYPTYDLAGFVFGADRSRCCRWANNLLPLLERALGRSIIMPKRKISSVKELVENCSEAKDLFIDGTERKIQRPKKSKLKKKRYSGKKKMHTRKNIIVCDEKRRIIYVSPSKDGKIHDYKQLQKTGILEHIPKGVTIWVDKGFQRIKVGLKNNNSVLIPHKKPRGKTLTKEHKEENKVISGIPMVVEHAINGVKRFGVMSDVYRNRRGQDDNMIYACSALWNFHLQYATS